MSYALIRFYEAAIELRALVPEKNVGWKRE
jgi:hypothetical protein